MASALVLVYGWCISAFVFYLQQFPFFSLCFFLSSLSVLFAALFLIWSMSLVGHHKFATFTDPDEVCPVKT